MISIQTEKSLKIKTFKVNNNKKDDQYLHEIVCRLNKYQYVCIAAGKFHLIFFQDIRLKKIFVYRNDLSFSNNNENSENNAFNLFFKLGIR